MHIMSMMGCRPTVHSAQGLSGQLAVAMSLVWPSAIGAPATPQRHTVPVANNALYVSAALSACR